MSQLLHDVSLSLGVYLLLALACYGWGQVTFRLLRVARAPARWPMGTLWLGWAVILLVFQTAQLCWPLTEVVVVPVLGGGALWGGYALTQAWRQHRRDERVFSPLLLLVLGLIVIWVACRSLISPYGHDSALYHFNTMQWLNTYALEPGLGNLHGRLAFNQAFLTFAAALNFYPWGTHGASFANSFLFLLLCSDIGLRLARVARAWRVWAERQPLVYAADLMVIPMLIYLAMTTAGFSSPIPDVASYLLQVTLFLMFVNALGTWLEGAMLAPDSVLVIAVLSATAITVKLSNLVFSALLVMLVVALARRPLPAWRQRVVAIVKVGVLPLALLGIWCVRGVVLSGCPLYPATVGRLPLDWAVPAASARAEAESIFNYGRKVASDAHLMGHTWGWVKPWFLQTVQGYFSFYTWFCPLLAALLVGALATLVWVWQWRRPASRRLGWAWLMFIPLVGTLIFWFLTSPDTRFIEAIFGLLAVAAALLLLTFLRPLLRPAATVWLVPLVWVIVNAHFLLFVGLYYRTFAVFPRAGWEPPRTCDMEVHATASGLLLYTPAAGQESWNLPLLYTPAINPQLRLRRPGDLASGFTVAPPAPALAGTAPDRQVSGPMMRE